MQAWFESDPERLQQELSSLEAAGIEYTINNDLHAEGRLELALTYNYNGEVYRLRADYPDLFPHFQPDVYAEGATLPRHHHPNGGHLCLLGRRTDQWHVNDTLAGILAEQLPRILDYAVTRDEAAIRKVEEPQGEPVSEYFNGAAPKPSYILIDGAWSIPSGISRGELTLRYAMAHHPEVPIGVVTGFVEEIRDTRGTRLATWSGPKPLKYHMTKIINWVRVDPAPAGTVDDLAKRLSAGDKAYLRARSRVERKNQHGLYAALFQEELEQFQYGDGWAFVEEFLRPNGKNLKSVSFPLRVARAGLSDLSARMPSVKSLQDRRVAIVGLGAIGSFVALELARSGAGKLTLLDSDYMEPATARRWAIGWEAFGEDKPAALKRRISADYPWTRVEAVEDRIGGTGLQRGAVSQRQVLGALVTSHDLVIDLSAELGVNHYLSALCRVNEVPFLVANVTPGSWGGMVAQFVPYRKSPCWDCLRHDLYGTPRASDLPVADPEGMLQPAGCASRTFTGTSFDVQEVALEVVRMACGIVSQEGYPPTDWDLSLLNLRREDGGRLPPQWTGRAIRGRPSCECTKA